MSYEFLIKSKTWLMDQHKLCHILSSWGVAFKEVKYNKTTGEVCSEILQPEDVIINQNTVSLEKCKRFTVRNYVTKNEILCEVNKGCFTEPNFTTMDVKTLDNTDKSNDTQEPNPVYEILKQFIWLDLDDDNLSEPYFVFVHKPTDQLLGIYPAFEMNDLILDPQTQKLIEIKPRHNLIDYHLINDPEGKYHSLGLNYILLHLNKAITAILRQLIDSGILANVQGGFITKAFKTREKTIRPKMGQFTLLDVGGGVGTGVDISKQIMPLPYKEPSQVLLGLLTMLIECGKTSGFMSDLLTGDAQMQNVPATTILAMIEQGTRAFKPVVQKLYHSEKTEFQSWFHFQAQNMKNDVYFRFNKDAQQVDQQGQPVPVQTIVGSDFDEESFDIIPVADPTMCSEAHKYARLQAIIQLFQTTAISSMNMQQSLLTIFKDLQFPNPESFIMDPANRPPDPKMLQVQLSSKIADQDHEIKQLKELLAAKKIDLHAQEIDIKREELGIKAKDSTAKTAKVILDAHKADTETAIKVKNTHIQQQLADTNHAKLGVLASKQRNSNGLKKP